MPNTIRPWNPLRDCALVDRVSDFRCSTVATVGVRVPLGCLTAVLGTLALVGVCDRERCERELNLEVQRKRFLAVIRRRLKK